MCDVCADFHDLLLSYEERASKEPDDVVSLCAIDVDTILHYVNQWVQRQCMCCYREAKNFDRFVRLTQSVVLCTLQQLRAIRQKRKPPDDGEAGGQGAARTTEDEEETEERGKVRETEETDKRKRDEAVHEEKSREKTDEQSGGRNSDTSCNPKHHWTQQDREKLFHLLSKIFLLNFPLYIAMKHGGALNPLAPVKDEGGYCEPHDPEVPAPLIRAVSVFCHQGGFELMSACFDSADHLPVGLAHSMVAVICNLKLWLNYGSVIQLFTPLRSRVMKYMCRLGDKELRTPAVRTMADFMWSAVKDPIDAVLPTFDRDGLDLAFKYFTSTTLTMRLAGVAQINAHITAFNELCNSETVAEVEQVGHALAAWLTENNIIAHIFGPNLHAEVIKQSHIVLSFLAMEGRITSSDMDTMWQAAQLKHCARPVYDLLAPLVKHLAPTPVLHLYSLLGKLEPKDHTEQSLFLASALIKFIWTSGGPGYPGSLTVKNRDLSRTGDGVGESSSSDPSGIDASSPEEDEEEPSPAPSEGPSPRKQARGDSSDCEGNCKRGKSPGQIPVESNLAEVEDFSVAESSKLDRPSIDMLTESPPTASSPIDDPVLEDTEATKTDNESKDKQQAQSASDAEADTEKSNTEEAIVQENKKRKVLRKRKKPQKRVSELPDEDKVTLNEIVETEDAIDSREPRSNNAAKDNFEMLKESRLERKVSRDTLDCVKEQQQRSLGMEPTDQQVPTAVGALQLRGKSSEKYMSLVSVDGRGERGPDSVESSHDEDDSDNAVAAGVVVGSAGGDGTSAVISDLAGLVHATGQPFLPSGLDEMLSDEEGSYSSRISNKSEKNMADFDGEESGCEEELAQLAARHLTAIQMQAYHPHSHHHHHHQHHPQHQPHHHHHPHHHGHHHSQPGMSAKRVFFSPQISRRTRRRNRLHQQTAGSRLGSQFNLESVCKTGASASRFASQFNLEIVCKPGSTLLWDLLQDDKIGQLGEGLALEAEKALCNLLCFNVDRLIPMKFIEGCLENLAANQSVVISLRLLPKLLASFQQFGAMDAHTITTWADRERGMMKHFFNNLKTYASTNASATAGSSSSCSSTSSNANGTSSGNTNNLYSHQTEIQVRLQFLSSIFSPLGSPDCFRLSLEQVDILWQCLSQDPTCADELFSWLLSQAKSTEQHALGMDTLKHLCLRKLPSLPPETISMTGLSLFQQLCNLARLAAAHLDRPLRDVDSVGMDFLWRIALRAKSTDVSMAAIQYLNGYYMSRQLTQEAEFVSQCMTHLAAASADLENNEEASLRCIQRALLLLRTHLEAFRKRYAYHLRRWALEGRGAGSHVAMNTPEKGQHMRIFVQPAGIPDKTSFSLLSTDYVADLRAEVAKWWDDTQNGGRAGAAAAAAIAVDSSVATSSSVGISGSAPSVLGTLLTDRDGPIRMITQGQELTFDFDEKTLQEMGFKDGQLVFTSLGAAGARGTSGCGSTAGSRGSANGKRDIDSASLLPPPPKESLPTLLLLRPQYFEQLFTLMRTLSAMKTSVKGGQKIPNTKAQVLSRRVWDTLTLLPTSPTLLRGFQKLGETSLPELLDPASPQKLMYSLYIVESLSRRSPSASSTSSSSSSNNSASSTASAVTITPVHEGGGDTAPSSSATISEEANPEAESKETAQSEEPVAWSTLFVQHGGLRHLFDIFMSGCLERGDGSEWQQDCLASLLKQLCHLGVVKEEKKSRKHKPEKLIVPRLSEAMLSMMDVETVMPRLTSILNEASMPRDPNHYKTGLFGRSQVIHYAMALLVCWVHSDPSVRQCLFSPTSSTFGRTWLRRLVLEDPEPAVRREVCTALYRLCLGTTGTDDDDDNDAERSDASGLIVPMLNTLLEYLVVAEAMQPSHRRRPDLPLHLHSALDDGKEPYGPACRDYFWLVCRLVDALPEDAIREGCAESEAESGPAEGTSVDLEALAGRVIDSVLGREHLETRHNTVEDDALVGLLNLTCNIMTHNPACKQAKIGQNLLNRVFDFLFDLPNPRMKHVPKCKSQVSRSAAFDLLVELVKSAPENYRLLHEKLLAQHRPGPHSPYPWDYWPHEDGRSDCGYVGLTNLGATCYMASCMQHLYMMPQARVAILGADCNRANKHQLTLRELQRMFAYLLESERKAYNPRSFCRVYTMNHEPLNTGEQKDMAEFFIDLVSKLEEMTSDLKHLVKTLFCGVISNNVVSLDCEHVSRTLEEFYTVRCQVADMRNLYESLDEVTVKDTLEGDNMYTCSQCGKKARAEKRACFKKLPHILCFNTMRYTFNMGTMLKEKVNTHFSFPLRLDMSGYVEKKLMPQHYREEQREREGGGGDASSRTDESEPTEMDLNSSVDEKSKSDAETQMEHYQYDLIGVTVHTGTADGGHYYSFIRDRTSANKDKWFLFNDAEVKPFDPSQIAAECFGGEMTSKTYDSVTDKFMDFSFEKTNSAYMLFYEWCSDPNVEQVKEEEATVSSPVSCVASSYGLEELNRTFDKSPPPQQQPQPGQQQPQQQAQQLQPAHSPQLVLNKELEDWIWQDNTHFLQDKNIFEHTYFSFMWQICGYIPQTLLSMQPDVTELSAELSTSFFMETFIHAKEKPTMVQWVELLTKQFNGSAGACARFLERMAGDSWWPIQILVKCPNQMVRQMFQRLCIHVIQRLRPSQAPLYLLCENENDSGSSQYNGVGTQSCVTRFVRMLLSLMEHAKQHLKHLTEYFGFLYEFSKMGEEETLFLIRVQAVSTMVNFYLGHKTHETADAVSEEEEEEEEEVVLAVASEKLRPASLDKMITLIATLVERSRGPDHRLTLSPADLNAVAGGKGFPFLYQQTRDVINLNQTRNLIQSLCRWNDRLAIHIVTMIFQAITKHTDVCQPFFKLLTLLTEGSGPSGLPCMTQLILSRVWEAARVAPHGALEWLALAVTRSKLAHAWVLQGLETWLQHFLIEHLNHRVRSAAAFLLVSLVPSTHFRQGYRGAYRLGLGCNSSRELQLSSEATIILHQIYTALLRLLQPARHYIDIQTHGTMSLTAYFALLTYCAVSKTEKLMFGQYLNDLWTLFHPKLSEPSIPVHHNKQAVLLFWYHVCCDCPENVTMILHNPHITKNIAFNYILADHEDQDVVLFNRVMLPAYYGLLRLCCQHSRVFTRQLAAHQNIQWAFKNITPHPTQYSTAVDELFKLMQLLVTRHPDQTEQEEAEIASFRRGTLSSYLQGLDGRSCWATLISAFRCLIESDDDRLYVVYNGGLSMALEAFHMLHIMYHEATACHVAGDLAELIAIIVELVRCVRTARDGPDARNILANCKEWPDVLRKLATLLNTYNPPDMRNLAIDLLKELVMLVPAEAILILAPLLSHCHAALQESHAAVPPGPYLPRRSTAAGKMGSRPARPMVQMAVPHSQLEAAKGVDPEYDSALLEFYLPYHELIDVMCRLAINNDCMTDTLVNLSAMLGFEGVPLHLALFPRLWLDVHAATHIDRKHIAALLCSSYTVDYVDAVLLDERSSLGVPAIHAFLKTFFPKLANHVLTEQTCSLIDNLVSSMSAMVEAVDIKVSAHRLTGDLRALALVYSSGTRLEAPPSLLPALETLLARTRAARIKETSQQEAEAPSKKRKFTASEEGSEETARRKAHSPTDEVRGSRDSNSEMDVEDKDKTEKEGAEVKSSETVDERLAHDEKSQSTKIERSSDGTSISSSLVSASGTGSACANQLLCSLTNVSWLEMLEKTIINLQVIVTLQTKNN